MMSSAASLIAAAALVTGTALLPQRPPVRSVNQLPNAVKRSILALNMQCQEAGGQPGRSPDLVRFADLTGDGVGDYVVVVGSFQCTGAPSAMENGQSGAGLQILAGGPGNTATPVYNASVYGAKIETAGGKPVLWVDVAALDCGQRNAARVPFSDWTFCSRALVWNAARNTFGFAPLAQARRVQ